MTLTNESFNSNFVHKIILTNSFGETTKKDFVIQIGSESNTTTDENSSLTTVTIPTLNYPLETNQNNITIQVSGNINNEIILNNLSTGNFISQSGTANLDLNLTNEGENNFSIALKFNDEQSDEVNVTIILDTTAPNSDAESTYISTDVLSPELNGKLASSNDDENSSLFLIKVTINGDIYEATNNLDGTWTLQANEIADLDEGSYDVNITIFDDANNSSVTEILDAFQINYSVFLINAQVEGLTYSSNSLSGITDSNGQLKYSNGDDIRIYLGNSKSGVELGSINSSFLENNSDANRKELDLLKLINGSNTQNSQKAMNVIRLLSSFDADKDMSNGIQIDEKTTTAFILANPDIDVTLNSSEFSEISDLNDIFNDLAPHFGEHRGLISAEDSENYVAKFISGEEITTSVLSASSSIEVEEIEILSGTLQSVEGVVSGVSYRSGMQNGITDENGTFFYENSKKIRFSIGMLELGETTAKPLMTPVDMVESVSFEHPKHRNIVRLLSLLDSVDGDSKITIDSIATDSCKFYRKILL